MTLEVMRIGPDGLEQLWGRLAAVYRRVFTLPPYLETKADVRVFASLLGDYQASPEVRCSVARETTHGRVLGFALGYTTEPGDWWYDSMTGQLSPERATYWLDSPFAFADLAVVPQAQGRGVGGRLHDALLAGLPHRVALLSTIRAATPASRLFRRRGWSVLVPEFRLPQSPMPYCVMGLDMAGRLQKATVQ